LWATPIGATRNASLGWPAIALVLRARPRPSLLGQEEFLFMDAQFDPSSHVYCRRLIRKKVNQLIGRYGWNRSDIDDLKQMFYLKLIIAMKKFDPSKGHEFAYIKAVIERHTATIIRDRRAAKRYLGKQISLNWHVEDKDLDGFVELQNLAEEEQSRLHRGIRTKKQIRLDQMRLDVATTSDQLPAGHHTLADDLMHKSVTQTSRERGVSRQSIYRSVSDIRSHFQRQELNQYLDDPKSEHAKLI
jgi:DNA-directed RNA polymerase specialized sigma24 family protein